MKKGDLIEHTPPRYDDVRFGLGIVIESWENQKIYPGVCPHDPEDLMVMFEEGTRMITRKECRLVEKNAKKKENKKREEEDWPR